MNNGSYNAEYCVFTLHVLFIGDPVLSRVILYFKKHAVANNYLNALTAQLIILNLSFNRLLYLGFQ